MLSETNWINYDSVDNASLSLKHLKLRVGLFFFGFIGVFEIVFGSNFFINDNFDIYDYRVLEN